jgi:hypothetical protein
MVSAGRGNIHTEVLDSKSGTLRAITALRTYVKGGQFFLELIVSANCPPQGCAPDAQGQTQDCTVKATIPVQDFDWQISQNGKIVPTIGQSVTVKQPSGTLILSQAIGNAGQDAINTRIRDVNMCVEIVSLRVYAKLHPGSTLIDFYCVIGFDPASTFQPDPPGQIQDKTTQGSPWYDMYWQVGSGGSTPSTIAESCCLDSLGNLVLDQNIGGASAGCIGTPPPPTMPTSIKLTIKQI